MIDPGTVPRDSRRVPLETRVQFKFDRFSGFLSEFSANVSPGGMFIRTQSPQPSGTLLEFEFRLGDDYELIKGKGEVVWNRPYDEGPKRPAGIGIRFLELSEGSLDLVYKIVDQHVLQGGIPFDVSKPPTSTFAVPLPDGTASSRPADDDTLDESVLTLHGLERSPLAPESPAEAEAPEMPSAPASPSRPARAEGAGAEDAQAWMPPFADLETTPSASPAPSPVPSPLELPPLQFGATQGPDTPRPATPASYVPTFGAASAGHAHESRRGLPLVLLVVGLVLTALTYTFKEQILGWIGPGGGDEPIQGGVPPVMVKRRAQTSLPEPRSLPASAAPTPEGSPLRQPGATPAPATPPGGTSGPAAAPSPLSTSAPHPAPPAAAPSASPPPNPPVEGKPFDAVNDITFEKVAGGTDILIAGNGAMSATRYSRSRIDGDPPRELFKLRGVIREPAKTRIPVGTGEVVQVRTGYHREAGLNELHVVLDLTRPSVVVTGVEVEPHRLRIHLQAK
jgi:uncharacterized protein (TIGR02266 family)